MNETILYVQYTNPAVLPPLQHSSRILANAGWKVLFLGTDGWEAEALQFPPHPNIEVYKLASCAAGWRQKLQFAAFALWVLAYVLRYRPSWIYVSDPLACPATLLLRFVPKLRLIYHEHDLPVAAKCRSRFMRLILAARRWLARRAELCILPNERRIQRFKKETGGKSPVLCAWNCPASEEAAPSTAPRAEGNDLWVWYHGSISPELLPQTVLHALALLPERIKLRAAGYETVGCRGYVQKLRNMAVRLGIDSRVEFVAAMPRYRLLEECRRCDIGLALMPETSDNPNFEGMCGASNKPFDYLACGLPVLVSDLPDWRAFFVDTGYGLACHPNDPESIAAVLRWLVEHPDDMRAMGEQGRQRIEREWNYERQFAPVLCALSGGSRRSSQ